MTIGEETYFASSLSMHANERSRSFATINEKKKDARTDELAKVKEEPREQDILMNRKRERSKEEVVGTGSEEEKIETTEGVK